MPARTAEPPAAPAVRTAAEPAPAKINLALHVVGRRPDGYHLIDTLAVFAGIGDMVRAEPRDDKKLDCALEGPFAADLAASRAPDDDLVLKAARALHLAAASRPQGMRLRLDKRLPVGSGIGGGSADAAAALRLLDRVWGLDFGRDRLAGIAGRLGADVPMCLWSRPLRAEGIGELLSPAAGLPSIPLLLANAGGSVSTKAVFGRLEAADDRPLPPLPARFRSVFELVIWLRQTTNGLEAAARAETPSVGRTLTALKADPDCLMARMSGSGATCFGIFASEGAAQRAAVRLRVRRPDWWIAASMTGES